MIAPAGTSVQIGRNAIKAIIRFYQNSQDNPEGPQISASDAASYRRKVYYYMRRPELLRKCNRINGFTAWDGKYDIAYSKEARWYFGYQIENGKVHIYAARHQNNMSDLAQYQVESFIRRLIRKVILEITNH